MKMYKIAFTPAQNRTKIDNLDRDMKAMKRDLKKAESEVKKLTKQIDSLNIGHRRFWQQTSTFTSLQRKLERFEKVEQEWKKYKNEMDAKIKREIEKNHRAQIQSKGSPV